MTAYGALISLQNTIHYISYSSHFNLVEPSLDIIELLYKELQPLQAILERLDSTSPSRSRKKVNALDGRIKDLIWEFEDKLESLLTDQILSQIPADQVDEEMKERVWEFKSLLDSLPSQQIQLQNPPPEQVDGRIKETTVWQFQALRESLPSQEFQFQSHVPEQVELTTRKRKGVHTHNDHSKSTKKSHASQSSSSSVGARGDELFFSIDLRCLPDDVGSFIMTLNKMKKEYNYEVRNMGEDDEAASSTIGFVGTNEKMIGLSDQFQQLKEDLTRPGRDYVQILRGMAGVGKTTLAKKIYEDPQIQSEYECRAWVTVGRKPQPSQVLRGILAQLCGITLIEEDEEQDEYLKQRLEGKKCLIVLDDVWETQVLRSLFSFLPIRPLSGLDVTTSSYFHKTPNLESMITILLIARDTSLTRDDIEDIDYHFSMVVRRLSEEESKNLLCEKVFGEESCPPQLDKAATKIAKNCEGLPLMIVTVANIISKSDHNGDLAYWEDVAEERNSVFTDAYNEISKVLFPSYDYLPQYLKMPFLFLGVFPGEYDIPPYKVINMFNAEGWFLRTNTKESFEDSVWSCLDKLCTDKNLVLFNKKSRYENVMEWNKYIYKTCRLHSSWRYVCKGEARKNKFYQVLNRLVDAEEEGHRGLCLQNNILLGIKDIRDSMRLNCASFARSLLFLGPYNQYPTPLDIGFRLLRELDALQLRFYTFPTEILALVQLKYLALTCNGELPATISKLFNLQVLIFHPHISIRCCKAPSYVPIQIWDMKELEHIEILGKSLVAPNHVASLEKLLTLVGVNASIATILELSRRIPNIRKLAIQIELAPYDDHTDLLSCFGSISALECLKTLKCSIINPVAKSGYVFPATSSSLKLPGGLRKLHLSGMCFPWEYMDVIGSLPNLEELKLRSYAFRGPKWEAQEESFSDLEFLLIEDSDLEYLNLDSTSFPVLRFVCMKHCYKLEGIHWPLYSAERKIELVDCNPLAFTCAEQLHMSKFSLLDVTASTSFYAKPMTINLKRNYGDDEDTDEDINEDLGDDESIDYEYTNDEYIYDEDIDDEDMIYDEGLGD